jgi:hypothetical protein
VSYDVSIADESFNYTSNVAAFFYDHLLVDGDAGISDGLPSLDGLTGKEAAHRLASAFEDIERTRLKLWNGGDVGEPALCAKYDASNGWGSTVGAILFLARIQSACIRHPRSLLRVSA